jgi:hypothetical protein
VTNRLRHLEPEQTEELGRFCATLLNGDDQWIFRRRESVTVLDEATVRRRQSVDFTLDMIDSLAEYESVCNEVFGDDVCAAPLFILDKDPASTLAFDLKDESGCTLSLMTTEENGEISAATLKVLCREKLAASNLVLDKLLEEKIEQLAKSDPVEGGELLEWLQHPSAHDPDQAEVECLFDGSLDGGQMEWWMTTLAYYSIVMVTFEPNENHRRVIKIAYEQPMTEGQTPAALLAIRSFKAFVSVPLMKSARYHFDVKAPPDFKLTQLILTDSKSEKPNPAPGMHRWAQLHEDDVGDARSALVRFGLRVSGHGVLGGALVAAILVVAAIFACMKNATQIVEDPSVGPTLLLVLPGIIATYVARADQHGLTTRLLAWPRWILLLGSGVTAYFAAGVIAVLGQVEETVPTEDLTGVALQRAMVEHAAAVADQVDAIQHWLQYPLYLSIASTSIILIGWICTRESTHWVLRILQRGWEARSGFGTDFDIETSIKGPISAVRTRLESETSRLEAEKILQNTTISFQGADECSIYRSFGPIGWGQLIEIEEAALGTNLRWTFQAGGPGLLKPVLVLLTLWERKAVAYRIAAFRREQEGD